MPPATHIRILQITDTHLFADPNQALLGVKSEESFRALIDLVKSADLDPDFILMTGDLAQDASEKAYIRLGDELSEFGVPVYCIPGNHDDTNVMEKIYPYAMMSLQKQLVFDGWQIILLDSHIHAKVEGRLAKSELDFMEKCLKMHPKHQAIIVFHHHPIPVGCEWLDNLAIKNSDELWDILKNYPQVSTIFFGHVHQLNEGEKNNIKYYSTPSTCIQFKRKSDQFALEELGPGFRIIDLYPDGKLETSVRRVPRYIGTFEPHAKGY